jgi:hypothetical protein
MKNVPAHIIALSEQLEVGQSSRRYRVRAILKWFDASRRGANVLNDIEATLKHFGLTTEPPISSVGIDEQVRFVMSASSGRAGATRRKPDRGSGPKRSSRLRPLLSRGCP